MTKLIETERPLNPTLFECSSHPRTMLTGLQDLRRQGLLLDVTLHVGGETFFAHKAVLASCSDYFRAMFTDAMKESRESEITLNGMTPVGIRLLLDYAYCSRLEFTLANIQDVLSVASHVQVVAVVEACSIYLQTQIDLDNCIDIATLAETYSLKKLRHEVYRFMSAHLREFARTTDFKRLSPAQLDHLLTCDFPVDCTETEVLEIVIEWIRNSSDSSRPWDMKILRRVNFEEIPLEALDASLQSFDPYFYRKFKAEMRPALSLRESRDVPPLVNSRGMELAMVKVGGFGLGGVTNEVTYYLASAGKWLRLTSIPHVEQCNFGTAVLDNKLFVVGGCFNLSLEEDIHPFGFRYCPQANEWHTIAPMHKERCRFSLNVVGGRLFAVGGNTQEDDARLDEEVSLCEAYDPSRDCWDIMPSAPGHRTQHAAAAWPATSSHSLFISGGLDRDFVLAAMHCFDTRTGTWTERAQMRVPRADHVMLTIGNYIYVCGGWGNDETLGNRVLVNTIDRYDVDKDSWETLTRIPSPRYHAGIVCVQNTIYFIGGFHSDDLFDREIDFVDCYDIDADSWSSKDKYPQNIWEHSCVTLYVPRCRNDMPVLPLESII